MHLQEHCKCDLEMSEYFLKVAENEKYVLHCKTSIGWVTVEEPEYRNGVSYRVISKIEIGE